MIKNNRETSEKLIVKLVVKWFFSNRTSKICWTIKRNIIEVWWLIADGGDMVLYYVTFRGELHTYYIRIWTVKWKYIATYLLLGNIYSLFVH